MPRTSIPAADPRQSNPWRRRLIWAALLTLVASALYFSLAGDAPPANTIETR